MLTVGGVDAGKKAVTHHDDWVQSVRWSPDGQTVATGGFDAAVFLLNADTLEPLRELEGHEGRVRAVDFSPDWKSVVTGCEDGFLRVYEADTGKLVSSTPNLQTMRPSEIVSVSWNPDGRSVLIASGHNARVWRVSSSQSPETVYSHKGSINQIAWSVNGKKVLSVSNDRTAVISSTGRQEVLSTYRDHPDAVLCGSWACDGTRVATGCQDGKLRVFDTLTDKLVSIVDAHKDWVMCVQFSPDTNNILASCGFQTDKTCKVWETDNGELLQSFTHGGGVNTVSWKPDGRQLVTGGCDFAVCVWNVELGEDAKAAKVVEGHEDGVRSVAWSPDGRLLASGADDTTIRIWDGDSGELLKTLEGHKDWVNSVTWSPDGTKLASASGDKTVRVYDTNTGKELVVLKGHSDWVQCVQWAPDGTRAASCAFEMDKSVRIWNLQKKKAEHTLVGHTDRVNSVAWSPDSSLVASGSDDKTIVVWDTTTGKQCNSFQHAFPVRALAWSPDGKHLACGIGKLVVLYDLEAGSVEAQKQGHRAPVYSVAWSPNGQSVVSSSQDKSVRVWTLGKTEDEKSPGFQLDSPVHCVAWHEKKGVSCACASGRLIHLDVEGLAAEAEAGALPAGSGGTNASGAPARPPLRWQKSFRRTTSVSKKPSLAGGLGLDTLAEEDAVVVQSATDNKTSRLCTIL
eukprot:m.40932 g.40932  ORF g.40932 m.40932 type:complete len:682 (+) comp11419_c0_seq1:841-2886(+)